MSRRIVPMLLVLLCICPVAYGTTVVYADLESMTRDSNLIFHATVRGVETRNLGEEEEPRIVTDVTLTVHRVFKGSNPGAEFNLRLVGGAWGGRTLAIPGMPRFHKGEEVVLFLEWTGKEYAVCGMRQGKYSVTRDENGIKWSKRNFDGLGVVLRGPEGESGEVLLDMKAEPRVRLKDLFKKIREYGGKQGKQ